MYFTKKSFFFIFIIAVFLCGCGGGGGDSSPNEYSTGNEDFDKEEAQKDDPLAEFRVDDEGNVILPESIDHSSKMPMVRHQGHSNSCTAWAVGYYAKTYQEVMEEGWDINDNSFSPGYLFAMQCRNFENPLNLNVAWETLKNHGIAKWDSMPFENLAPENKDRMVEIENYANLEISDDVHEEAKIYRCGEMTQLTSSAQIKQALTKGPVIFAIWQYASPQERPTPPEENYMRVNLDKKFGHAVTCVGYDDKKFGEGAYKFINSWGTEFGEGGFSWIKYSDQSTILAYAMTYKDIQNPGNPDEQDATTRPEPPTNVEATDAAGPYVEITWNRSKNAQYYRIYRVKVGVDEVNDDDTYKYHAIGVSHQGNYRDYPPPGTQFYYSVIAVNELGESQHLANDTDAKAYVDIGSSIGTLLQTPKIEWVSNDGEVSNFTVEDVDPQATSMEVLISTNSEGPWNSLGWIKPDHFSVKLGQYAGKQPFVKVRVANAEGYSQLSEKEQVIDKLHTNDEIAKIVSPFMTSALPDKILLRWKTDDGKADYFETWRYAASNDQANDWVKIGYSQPTDVDEEGYYFYEDSTAMPGIGYYYAVFPVYQGTYGEQSPDLYEPVRLQTTQPNLHLTSFQYYYTKISSPTEFPLVQISNDGPIDIEQYTIGVSVYDSENDEKTLILEVPVTDPLRSQHQQEIRIPDVDIPSQFMDGRKYSWVVSVDYNDDISETYEDDNELYSKDIWWIDPQEDYRSNNIETGSDSDGSVPVANPKIGSSRPFSKKKDLNIDIGRSGNEHVAKDQLIIDDGPIQYQVPDFCNDHSK